MYWELCSALLAFVHICYSQTDVNFITKKGPIIGLRWNPNPRSQASYDAFIGIPYGQIPKRFQRAVPRSNWTAALLTQADGPACPQPPSPMVANISEDCLYLNVFTPVNASQTPGMYPVMAFIHGSAFTWGSSSSSFFTPDFLIPEGIILVTMNYRLGAPGFLSMGSSIAPGNLGLTDTYLALEWIQQEIYTFGGDPGKVTLVGQSAGSVMTMYHYLSPVSSAKFRSAIAHSGSALSTWGIVTSSEAARRAKELAKDVGCDIKQNDSMILQCLQTTDIDVLIDKQNISLPIENIASGNQLPFVPVLDTDFGTPAFFTSSLENQTKEAAGRSKPLITGFTTEEGILLFGFDSYTHAESHLSSFVPRGIPSGLGDSQKTNLAKKIENKYFPNTVDQNKVLELVHLYTDYLFAYPAIDVVRQLENITYGYIFAYDGSWAPVQEYFKRYQITGVMHGDDLYYLFYTGQDLSNCLSNQANLNVKNNMVKWWTSFIKNGVPDASWGTASNGNYLWIDSTVRNMSVSDVEDSHYIFWANMTDLSSAANTATISIILTITSLLCLVLERNL